MSQAEEKSLAVKTRHRSPNYPGVSLRAAVDRLAKQYKADGVSAAPKMAALANMGFEKLTGDAGRLLSALKSFGLADELEGRLKFTQRGLDILARPEDDPRRIAALREAALSPQVYRDLLKEYKSGLPSEATLKAELIAVKKFNPNAVDDFTRDFRVTLEFAGLSDTSSLGSDLEDEEVETVTPPDTLDSAFSKEREHGKMVGQGLSKIGERMRNAPLLSQTLVVSIPRDFKVDITVRGDELKKDDLAKIKNQFNRWIQGLEEAFD